MERTKTKQAVKLPEGTKAQAKASDDKRDTVIVLFMPDGRQITFRIRNDHAKAIHV